MKKKVPLSGKQWQANITEATAVLEKGRHFFLAANLDADAIGSMLALAVYLTRQDKKAHMVLAETLGDNLDFLSEIIAFYEIGLIVKDDDILSLADVIDTIVFCDTANTKLMPLYSAVKTHLLSKRLPVIEIDHHFGADSEPMTAHGIRLFRHANANTEIIAELLSHFHRVNPHLPDPFDDKSIIFSLVTGLFGDTLGGKIVTFKKDYEYWINLLGSALGKAMDGRMPDGRRTGRDPGRHFASIDDLLDHLNRLIPKKQHCLDAVTERIVTDRKIAVLNLLPAAYPGLENVCRPFDSEWFGEILEHLYNVVPEKSGKVGIVYFEGKNMAGIDCIFIKLRRAAGYDGFDLRKVESAISKAFPCGRYLGGGGHPGAVSFRVQSMPHHEFQPKITQILNTLQKNL
ncbi:MAG: hypothetical protein Q8P24_20725 [Desulfobacterales bacterium]|nr:hypothetical protein [Desulfobacterales bacterium]